MPKVEKKRPRFASNAPLENCKCQGEIARRKAERRGNVFDSGWRPTRSLLAGVPTRRLLWEGYVVFPDGFRVKPGMTSSFVIRNKRKTEAMPRMAEGRRTAVTVSPRNLTKGRTR